MPDKRHLPDPYCAFKDDKERRFALISRDVRFVLQALIWSSGGTALLKLVDFLTARWTHCPQGHGAGRRNTSP